MLGGCLLKTSFSYRALLRLASVYFVTGMLRIMIIYPSMNILKERVEGYFETVKLQGLHLLMGQFVGLASTKPLLIKIPKECSVLCLGNHRLYSIWRERNQNFTIQLKGTGKVLYKESYYASDVLQLLEKVSK